MSKELPIIYLARYSKTAWSLTGLPLTMCGEHAARQFGERLPGLTFAKVFMALALTPFLIALALAAQGQAIAASAPLTIQLKTWASIYVVCLNAPSIRIKWFRRCISSSAVITKCPKNKEKL